LKTLDPVGALLIGKVFPNYAKEPEQVLSVPVLEEQEQAAGLVQKMGLTLAEKS